MSKFIAGWNLPGCLPEMEPATFDTKEEAEAFIKEEQERVADWLLNDFGFRQAEDQYVYWVEPVDDGPTCSGYLPR